MTLGRFPRGLIAILALPQASCTSASISQGVAVPTQTLENCPLPAVLSIYQYYASSLAASSSVSVVFGSGTSLDGGCDATSSGGDGSSQTSTGANVLMIDHTANDTPYKSTATGNGYTNYTVSLVSDAPNKSTRYFKIYKPDGDGDFGPDVDGSQFLHVVKVSPLSLFLKE
ncbi:hypothetical protein, variant [Cryptococcus amylolentus CBS 6039]|uniref:Uncharacterized protein n=1 Tax=Cryptococcus amylolentus CBS 6039 TaxID=1295533 RepID=A0A1E3I3K1_9TREE|nr:hypothetical protein, variant [Cryptococcus amylolentus CBS 6039]ODN83240.1 hypothetical protein, variant [Cryptococcus amylolentus CBS 6039]